MYMCYECKKLKKEGKFFRAKTEEIFLCSKCVDTVICPRTMESIIVTEEKGMCNDCKEKECG